MKRSLIYAMAIVLPLMSSTAVSAAEPIALAPPSSGIPAGINGAQKLSKGNAVAVGVGAVVVIAAIALATESGGDDDSSAAAPTTAGTTTATTR
jgi:hypothetical protein